MNLDKSPEMLFPDLYRIQVPLPGNPLKYTNSYVIGGKKRFLVVDTGLNQKECKTALVGGLTALKARPEKTDFLITHLHTDHFGLAPVLASSESRIFFSRPDSEIMENWEGFGTMMAYAAVHGFPEEKLQAALNAHPARRFGTEWMPPLSIIRDGETIKSGPYCFQFMETPGHTKGHMCLYEPQAKILLSGDHVLGDITPNIQCWSNEDNPLQSYLKSLDRVRDLPVKKVLPGHRRIFSDLKKRVDQLKAHHTARLEEVENIVGGKGPVCAYDVAGDMTWDLKIDKWENFPVAQQWFATGEAISHLRYLAEENRIAAVPENGKTLFCTG